MNYASGEDEATRAEAQSLSILRSSPQLSAWNITVSLVARTAARTTSRNISAEPVQMRKSLGFLFECRRIVFSVKIAGCTVSSDTAPGILFTLTMKCTFIAVLVMRLQSRKLSAKHSNL